MFVFTICSNFFVLVSSCRFDKDVPTVHSDVIFYALYGVVLFANVRGGEKATLNGWCITGSGCFFVVSLIYVIQLHILGVDFVREYPLINL